MVKTINKLPGISLLINTKNEEKNIKDCIESVKSFASEIIIIDMQSTDNTVAIAKKYNVSIYRVKDYKWVEPVRNYGISKAIYEWILILDADERITPNLTTKLIEIVKDNKYDVVKIPRKNLFFNKWIQYAGWWPDYQIRFFRKGCVKWVIKIHPEIKTVGRLLELEDKENFALLHENARDIKTWLAKIDHHTTYEDYFYHLKKIKAQDIINRLKREFFWRYFEKKGYLDGIHGFILSKFMEFYRFLEFVKFWEKRGYPNLVSDIDLKETIENNFTYDYEQIKLLQKENSFLKQQLDQITSSKTFKIWQNYCQLRDRLKRKF